VISLVVILARFVWIFPATYLPRRLIPAIARQDPPPPWQWPFALAFTGVRGIVSLAAALAVPLLMSSGQPFPQRDLILFLTYSVIVVTLVGQGLLLPTVIRALGLVDAGACERSGDRIEEIQARRLAIEAAIEHLQQLAAERELPEAVTQGLHTHYRGRLQHFEHEDAGAEHPPQAAETQDELELLLISAERKRINELHHGGALKDEARRRIERELDLRQAHLANHSH
jgi:CPA1 family monovalent cation:H+ antiporter